MSKVAKVSNKIKHEKRIVGDMIALYCRHHHHTQRLCDECRALVEYANQRTDRCPYMAEKSFCSQCKTHCYKPQMRDKIREVMRYSGPRMIFYHPIAALRHLYYSKIKNKG
ncbi:MAG: nitrous oxide-stimulated promoter family protein [Alistipes sp.]|nr:nitrous oxide-stimulated promoter family protein [Alistipes sp.]MBR2331607.1 nitrous oxide-stimulated promoter family protein [Alistipes sp.]MBR6663103.1 nitrous oxide-stimulated promoter family protein [Alistipes sp.]